MYTLNIRLLLQRKNTQLRSRDLLSLKRHLSLWRRPIRFLDYKTKTQLPTFQLKTNNPYSKRNDINFKCFLKTTSPIPLPTQPTNYLFVAKF